MSRDFFETGDGEDLICADIDSIELLCLSPQSTTAPANQMLIEGINPLKITVELKDAIERKSREQLSYEIPVDLALCSEEEKEHWLVKKCSIRNGGRVRENPLVEKLGVTAEKCVNAQGVWTKFIRERLTEEERGHLAELNRLCDKHIITDHLSENTRIRFLYGFRFNVE